MGPTSFTFYVGPVDVTHRVVALEGDIVVLDPSPSYRRGDVRVPASQLPNFKPSDVNIRKGYMLKDGRWYRECPH